MKRVSLSLVYGFMWPAMMLLVMDLTSRFDLIGTHRIGDVAVLLFTWPYYILAYIFPYPLPLPGSDIPRTEVLVVFWLIHMLAFASLFYTVSRLFAKRKWR